MPLMIVRHKVEDYVRWKTIFDSASRIRKMNGEKSCRVFRNSDDLNDISLLFEWEDLQRAVRYSQSEELKIAMKQAGVLEDPAIYIQDHEDWETPAK